MIAGGSAAAPSFAETAAFVSNGYGENSPGGYSLAAAFLTELVMSIFFLIVILGATDGRAPTGPAE